MMLKVSSSPINKKLANNQMIYDNEMNDKTLKNIF